MNYLDEIALAVRARPIPWEGYARSSLISPEDAAPFKSSENLTPQQLADDADSIASSLVNVLSSCTQDDALKFVLLFAADHLSVREFSDALSKQKGTWTALTKLLEKGDEQVPLVAAQLQTKLSAATLAPIDSIDKLFSYLGRIVSSQHAPQQELALTWISSLLQTKVYRQEFWAHEKNILPAIDAVIKPGNAALQSQYHALLSIWLLSFDKDIASSITTDYDTVDTVLQAAKSAVKEKVIRVAVATLLNLVQFAPNAAASLIGHRGLPAINSLAERKWSDEELREDITKLRDTLTDSFENMSTFEVYLTELNSKRLLWSPPHRSAAFWKANINEFKASDYKVLRKLLHLLAETDSPLIQAVACNDISFIVNEDPEATSVLTEENVKQKIMGLMESADPEVRYEALKATQAFISKLFKA